MSMQWRNTWFCFPVYQTAYVTLLKINNVYEVFFYNQNICSFRELRHHLNSWRLKLCGPYQWIYILTKLWNTVFIHYLNNNSRKLHTQEQVEILALTNSNVPQYVRLLWQSKVDYWKLQYLVRCKLYICTFYQHLPLWFF